EVLHELLLRIRAGIDFGIGAKLRMRPEDQVNAGGAPLQLVSLAVAALVGTVGNGMPLSVHGEQVDEEVVRQLADVLGEDAVFGPADIRAEHAKAAEQNRH